ncbi:MAG: hypothetical protein QNJ60_12680 [Xenococcaceae cyanobacterium MO_188.B19]|nr:hypothetical protein [Xenococcaceae cyanobacterium MO_188.B19]
MTFKKTYLSCSSLVLYVCLAGILLLQSNYRSKIISKSKKTNFLQEEQRLNSRINLQQIIPTFGFDNLKADKLFLSFIQYFGDKSAREETGYTLTPKYFATLMKYDTNFVDAYLTMANANTMYAGQPEKTISFIEELLDYSTVKSDSELYSLLWLYKAYDELLFLGDIKAAEFSYNQAKQLLSQHQQNSQKVINSIYFPNTQSLNKNSDIIQAQITAWSTVLPHVRDTANKQKIITRISNLKTELGNLQVAENK